MAAQSDSALKLSLLTGLATGIGSLAVYNMVSKEKKSGRRADTDFDDNTTVTSKIDQDYIDEDKQDDEDVRNVVNELIREMKSMKDTEPVKTTDGTNVFTEEWTMKLMTILFKYQLISHQIIKNQQ